MHRYDNPAHPDSPKRKLPRSLVAGTAAALALGVAAGPAAAQVKYVKPKTAQANQAPNYEAPVKTDRGAVLRLTRLIRQSKPVPVESRYNVNKNISNPDKPGGTMTCPVLRPLKYKVSGVPHYFALEQLNLKNPTRNSLQVTPLGGADEVDKTRNPENFYKFPKGTQTNPQATIALDRFGQPGAWVQYKTGGSPYLQDQGQNGEGKFINLAYTANCTPNQAEIGSPYYPPTMSAPEQPVIASIADPPSALQ